MIARSPYDARKHPTQPTEGALEPVVDHALAERIWAALKLQKWQREAARRQMERAK